MTRPRLSVIIPRYAMTREVAAAFEINLAALKGCASVPTEIIVIDNGSTVKMIDTPAQYVYWNQNRGVAPAWNAGRGLATGKNLAFVTTSTQVVKGWDWRLCEAAEAGKFIAMPYTNGAKSYDGLGITGWCWVISKNLADEVGPFDETFVPAQYEDTDFFHRAIYQHGAELVNVVGANVLREGGRKHSVGMDRFNWLHLANRFRYGWKHNVDPNDVPPFWKQPLRDLAPTFELTV